MGIERRQDERTRCSIPCQVVGDGKPVDGTVCDVSAGGLSVQVDMAAGQGDDVIVTLHARSGSIEVRGIVWHVRRGKVKGKLVQRLGLVLSEAPDEFLDLLPRQKFAPARSASGPKRAAAPKADPSSIAARPVQASTPAITPEPAKAVPSVPKSVRYRVRVKQESGPRTRSIMVFAPDEHIARVSARSETGEGWHILEVERA